MRHAVHVIALLAAALAVAAGPARAQTPTRPPGAEFRDCADCPPMVVVPAGSFVMGLADDDGSSTAWERPQHTVLVPSFALGRTHVTRGQFARFVAATRYRPEPGCWHVPFPHNFEGHGPAAESRWRSWRNPGWQQTDNHPVACVSYEDAVAYTAWLAARTGKPYRLPSEAEWEYAARAGTTGRRWWGDGLPCRFENIADLTWADAHGFRERDPEQVALCRDGYPYTSPAGRFRANPFGLHDMMGNAAHWVADCAHDSYAGAPTDGSAWMEGGPVALSGGCGSRVVRGHDWGSRPQEMAVAARGGIDPERRNVYTGFRVARTLP
jgi:formylglycine-generating enzyme required for sulfatase activity